jgi:hypothetical protein
MRQFRCRWKCDAVLMAVSVPKFRQHSYATERIPSSQLRQQSSALYSVTVKMETERSSKTLEQTFTTWNNPPPPKGHNLKNSVREKMKTCTDILFHLLLCTNLLESYVDMHCYKAQVT